MAPFFVSEYMLKPYFTFFYDAYTTIIYITIKVRIILLKII